MSDFLAEARVIVRPDTTAFRKDLEAQLLAATRGVVVPIPVAAAPTTTGVTAAVQQAQAAANAEVTATSQAVTKATLDQSKAAAVLGAETQRLTTADVAQERVNRLLAQSQAQLAEAETIASLKTTNLAANRARLAAASRAVATGERAVLAAISSGNEALVLAARNTLALATAQEAQFRTAVKATIEADALAAADARQAKAAALATKGVASQGLTMLGARGATLAASNSFLIGAAAAVFLAKSLEEATDAEETFRRTTLLLGDDLASQLADQAQGIGKAFALDDDDVLKFETQVGKILKAVEFTDERTASFSAEVVKLAADMAAFNRVPIEQTLKAITLGLAGNTRGLKQFAVLLSNAEVEQTAMTQSGKKNADELTRQELVLARYTLILRDAGFQVGAFAAQADSLTAQSQELSVNFRELQETIGKGLVPAVSGLVKGLNDTFDAFNAAASGAKRLGSELPIIGDEVAGIELGGLAEDAVRLNVRMITMTPVLGAAAFAMQKFGDSSEDAGEKLTLFDKIVGSVSGTLGGLSGALDKVRAGLPSQAQRDELNLTLASASGDQNQELAILKQREQRQEAFLNRLLEEPALTSQAIKLQTKAAAQLDQTRQEIQSILDRQVADSNRAASEANTARGKADQALLQMLGGQQDQARNQILRAQGTESLKDDLRFNIEFRTLLRKQKDIVAETVKDAQRRASELRSLTATLVAVGNEIKDLRRRQREAMRQAQEERLERLETGTRLDIELADINDNTKRRIKLRQDLIRQLQKESRVLKLTGNALKEQRNEIARVRAEIKAIQAEEKGAAGDVRGDAAKFFFEQLQAQQGFASNLLGNLITGPTAGLVGVPSPPSPGAGVQQAASKAAGERQTTPTSGQANTEIDVLRRILDELRRLNGSYDAPEAINQKKSGSGSMDTAVM